MIGRSPPKLPQNTPDAGDRMARRQDDQSVAAAERIGGAGHRLEGYAAPAAVDLRDGIAGEGHEESIGLVHPERQARLPTRRLELYPCESVGIGNQARKRGVELYRPDSAQLEEIDRTSLDGHRAAGRELSLVDFEIHQRRDAQPGVIDQP